MHQQPHCTHGDHQPVGNGAHHAGPESFFGTANLHRLNSGLGTPGVTRTLDLRIWNPLLCQLSYWRMNATVAAVVRTGHSQVPQGCYFADLVKGVLAKARQSLKPSLTFSSMPPLTRTACDS